MNFFILGICLIVFLLLLYRIVILDQQAESLLLAFGIAMLSIVFTSFLFFKHHYLLGKLLIIFIPGSLVLFTPVYTGYIHNDFFFWYPFVPILLTVIPYLTLNVILKNPVYYVALIYFFLLMIYSDKLLLLGMKKALPIVSIVYEDYTIYKLSHVLLFVFFNLGLLNFTRERNIHRTISEENELKLRGFMHHSLDGIVLANEKSKITFWNQTMVKITGINSREVINKTVWEVILTFIPSERKKKEGENIKKSLQSVYESNGTINANFYLGEIVHRNGLNTVISGMAFPIIVQQKVLIGLIFRDVTAERHAIIELNAYRTKLEGLVEDKIKELRDQKEFLENLFEHAADGIAIISPAGKLIRANESIIRMTGYLWDEVKDKPVQFFINQEDLKNYPLRFDLLKKGETVINNRRLISKTGEEIFFEMKTKKLADGNYQAIFRDITTRLKDQKRIFEQSVLLNKIIEQAAIGIARISLDGRWLMVNPMICKITGYLEKELIQKSTIDITPSEDVAREAQMMKDFIATGGTKPLYFEKRYVRKDGGKIWVRVATGLITDEHGNPDYYVSMISDITQEKSNYLNLKYKNDELLAAQEELQSSNEELRSINEELAEKNRLIRETYDRILESEEKYRSLFESSGDAIFIFQEEFYVVDCNSKVYDLLAIDGKNMEKLDQFLTDRETSGRGLISLLKNRINEREKGENKINRFETLLEKSDGNTFDAEITISSIKLDEVVYLQVIVRDISIRKHAEEQLVKSQQLLQSVINSIPFDLWVRDRDMKLILQNKKSKEIWGNFLGKGLKVKAVNSVQLKHWEDNNKEVFMGNVIDRETKSFEPGSKDEIYIREILAPVKEGEGIGGIVGINIDITQRKYMELELHKHQERLEELVEERTREIQLLYDELSTANNALAQKNERLFQQKNELEETLLKLKETQAQLIQSEKMASLGVLTAGLAHEINNPINFISSGIASINVVKEVLFELVSAYNVLDTNNIQSGLNKIENLKKELHFEELGKNLEQVTANIETGINRTTEIIRSLRTFSRSNSESFENYNLHEGIDSSLIILRNKIKNRIQVIKKYGKIPSVKCNPGSINQVFLNVLVNACDAIKTKGKIRIETYHSIEKPYINHVIIKISDTGHGIPDTSKKKIFEPFYTTKQVGEGTGLGLSISYSIIEQHKGTLEMESEVGVGTTFSICLPVNQK